MSLSELDEAGRRKLQRLFEEVLALSGDERATFVERECRGDGLLHRELLALLDAYDRSDAYFDELAQRIVAPVLGGGGEGDDDAPGAVGRQLSHYEILGPAGGGGMGVVYRARDVRLGRTVALKFLPARLAADNTARARLLAEAQAASALDHPNIAVVYDVGATASGQPFIAMAWYDGETLAQRLRRGALPIDEAAHIARQLAGALAAAHMAGIIHRDVKPANVVITRSGVAKLLDFGIARHVSAVQTEEHVTPGTLWYMSPEQTHGSAIDARTDVWSLGVMLYEMLAGRRPFVGDGHADVIEAIRTEEPPPLSSLRPELPPALGDVVARCLAKDPGRRHQTADDVAVALAGDVWRDSTAANRARSPSMPASRSIARARGRMVAAVIAAISVALLAYGAWAFARNAREAPADLPLPHGASPGSRSEPR